MGKIDGGNPWSTDCAAHATTDDGSYSELAVSETVMHEALHGHCRAGLCDNVDSMIEDSEHDLGIIRDLNGNNAETPLAGSTSAERGTCDSKAGEPETWTYKLSICERDGMQESAEHTAGMH